MAFRSLALGAILLGSTMVLSGCLDSRPPAFEDGDPPRPTVVAVIDSGVNPYHTVFGRSIEFDAVSFAARASLDATSLRLANQGSWTQRAEHDAPNWAGVGKSQLVAIAGTRLLAVSFRNDDNGTRILDENGHGTATASVVATSDPSAIIVSVEVNSAICANDANARCLVDTSIAEAMEWAATQPWIDVITSSLNVPASLPDPETIHPESRRFVEASRLAHTNGKLVVSSASNYPTLSVTDYFSGPPWVISVGAADDRQNGTNPQSARPADVTSNGTQPTASAISLDEWIVREGTSLAAPFVAGQLSRAIALVRASLGHDGGITARGDLANGQRENDRVATAVDRTLLRKALNATGTYFDPASWDPTAHAWFEEPDPRSKLGHLAAGSTVPNADRFVTMGWGFVNALAGPEIARRALEKDLTIPPQKFGAEGYMAEFQRSRESYWSQ